MSGIVVVGAGIAGLTLALSLHARGIACRVMESAREIRPLGVGINLLPHGTRVLTELGLGDALADVAVATRALEYRARDGRLIHSDPRGMAAGMPFASYSIHRGDLHAILHQALLERCGAGAVVAGARLLGYEQSDERVTARFEDRRAGGERLVRASALVGADGILSTVRAGLYPSEGPPRSAGIDMWRGLTWAPPFLDGRTMVIAGVHECKVVVYPVRRRLRDGLQLINWVAEHGERFGVPRRYGDWNDAADPSAFVERFAAYRFDFLDVPALIRACDACFAYPMVDRDPVQRWVEGRVALIGDAAHPMYPIGANGASQAILDAEALAECLASAPGDPAGALRAFERRRLAKANAVVLANRERGPEKLLQMADERLALTRAEIDAVTLAYRRVAGFERDELRSMAGRPRLWPRGGDGA
jgi:5-methylphenazine-1-carboxylate 1-monooxygenase